MSRFSAFLKEKKFGLPIWTWGVIVAVLVIALIYWRRKKAAEAAANTDTNATPLDAGQAAQVQQMPDNSGAGGGSFSPTPYSVGVDPGAGYPFSTDGSILPFAPIGDALVPQTENPTSNSPSKSNQESSSSALLKTAETPVSAKNPNFAQAAQARTSAGKSAGVPVPFGGVVGTTKLKNGATLTTYATGRQVEQAPGKSAYVTKRGSSAPTHPGAVL